MNDDSIKSGHFDFDARILFIYISFAQLWTPQLLALLYDSLAFTLRFFARVLRMGHADIPTRVPSVFSLADLSQCLACVFHTISFFRS
jgi:hypothetical protein